MKAADIAELSKMVNVDNKELFGHISKGNGIGRGGNPSVKGAHNMEEFYKTIDAEAKQLGLTREDCIAALVVLCQAYV